MPEPIRSSSSPDLNTVGWGIWSSLMWQWHSLKLVKFQKLLGVLRMGSLGHSTSNSFRRSQIELMNTTLPPSTQGVCFGAGQPEGQSSASSRKVEIASSTSIPGPENSVLISPVQIWMLSWRMSGKPWSRRSRFWRQMWLTMILPQQTLPIRLYTLQLSKDVRGSDLRTWVDAASWQYLRVQTALAIYWSDGNYHKSRRDIDRGFEKSWSNKFAKPEETFKRALWDFLSPLNCKIDMIWRSNSFGREGGTTRSLDITGAGRVVG